MANQKKPRIGAIVLACIILIVGIGFGALQIAYGLKAYVNTPSNVEIHRQEEYLDLMEHLEELLDDPEALDSTDVDRYLDSKLQNYDLTRSQEQDIRELYKETLEKAEEGRLEQEMAMNSLTREIIYYSQRIPNPDQVHMYMMRSLIIGGVSILLSLVIFVVLTKKRRG